MNKENNQFDEYEESGEYDESTEYADSENPDGVFDEDEVDPDKTYMKNFDMRMANWSIERIYKNFSKSQIDFYIDIQRGEVWNKSRASLYIHSLLLDLGSYEAPFLINKRTSDNVDEVMDGKQRGLSSLIRFINNEYKLTGLKNEPLIYYNGKFYQINGKRFKDFPEELQDKLMLTQIPIAYTKDATQQQKALIFTRTNNYRAMNSFDIARAYKKDMSDILSLADHEIFKILIGKAQIKKLNHHRIIMKSWIALFDKEPSFEKPHVDKVMKEVFMSEEEQNQLRETYDMLLEAYKYIQTLEDVDKKVFKRILNITSFLSYISFVERFDDDYENLGDWLLEFYSDEPEEYRLASQRGTSASGGLKIRLSCLEKSVNEFLSR